VHGHADATTRIQDRKEAALTEEKSATNGRIMLKSCFFS
jgi:hypothetical protein